MASVLATHAIALAVIERDVPMRRCISPSCAQLLGRAPAAIRGLSDPAGRGCPRRCANARGRDAATASRIRGARITVIAGTRPGRTFPARSGSLRTGRCRSRARPAGFRRSRCGSTIEAIENPSVIDALQASRGLPRQQIPSVTARHRRIPPVLAKDWLSTAPRKLVISEVQEVSRSISIGVRQMKTDEEDA
jgi:hypothetical protein